MNLEEILDEFSNFRDSFKAFRRNKNVTREALIEFEARIVDLKCDLRPHRKQIAGEYSKRDDKAASYMKYKLAFDVYSGTHVGEDGKPIYGKCSINQAEKFANGSEKYKSFLKKRTFYKEAYTNVTDLRGDMESYINLIKDMLKSF